MQTITKTMFFCPKKMKNILLSYKRERERKMKGGMRIKYNFGVDSETRNCILQKNDFRFDVIIVYFGMKSGPFFFDFPGMELLHSSLFLKLELN